ncbi:MAG: SGNH/GDSL hydrolase family protein, partial [Gillisia sp.]
MKNVFFLFILVLISGCSSSSKTSATSATPVSAKKYSYLALGDSYTIGEKVQENDRWPVQLVAELNEKGYSVAPPKIIAKTGWTTMDLIQGMNSNLAVQKDYDLVSILIGVNNQYQGQDIHKYEKELREIFRRAIDHSKTMEKGVFAVSIPNYGVTPFGQPREEQITKEIADYNAVFARVAADFNVDFYNITPISEEAKNNP